MLYMKRTAGIYFFMILLLLAALAGGLPVFAAEALSMTYGDPVPSLPAGATWNAPDPGERPNAEEEHTYTLTDGTTGTLTVKQRPVTVTPDPKTKTVGAADPVLTYQIKQSGSLASDDTLKGALTRVPGEAVGSYSILQGTLTNAENPNYAITFVSGKTLTITADSTIHDVTVSVKYGDSFSSSGKIPDQSYGTSAAAGLSVTLYQETANRSASLQFDADLLGGVQPTTPVTLYVALPSSFSKSKDYYVRRTYDDSDSRLTADIERHGDYYYVVFTTSVVDDATFRVIPKSTKSSDSNDYEVSSFWEDVIDAISDARNGDRIRVNTGTKTTMAAHVLRELKGLSITLSLKRSNGQTINIYGKDVGYISSGKDYYTMTELAREYDSSEESSSSIAQPSPSQTASSSCVQSSSAPAVPVAQPWTPAPLPVSSSLPTSSSSSEVSSSVPEAPSSSETEKEEESEIEIIAEEDEPYIDTDGESDGQSAGSAFYPVFVVGSLSAAGILAGIITSIACRKRR